MNAVCRKGRWSIVRKHFEEWSAVSLLCSRLVFNDRSSRRESTYSDQLMHSYRYFWLVSVGEKKDKHFYSDICFDIFSRTFVFFKLLFHLLGHFKCQFIFFIYFTVEIICTSDTIKYWCLSPNDANAISQYPGYKTKLYQMMTLLFLRSKECGVLFHCYNSQINSDPEWYNLLLSLLWV